MNWLMFFAGMGIGTIIKPIADYVYPNDTRKNLLLYVFIGIVAFCIMYKSGIITV